MELTIAVIGAAASVAISLFSALLNRWSAGRAMTTTLYERRLEAYPELFGITEAFRRSTMRSVLGTGDPAAVDGHFDQARARMSEWYERCGGLIMSSRSYNAFRDLRESVEAFVGASGPGRDDAAMVRTMWTAKNQLRGNLRRDIGLLFGEDDDRRPTPRRRSG